MNRDVEDLWPQWRQAAAAPEVDEALRALYARLDAAVAERGPTCWISGRCCNFEAYGHRLYVTGLEIAWFLQQAGPAPEPEAAGACPFQKNKMCSTHTIRPLGCRIYFCQQGTAEWQHELYEQFLNELRALHERLDLPYRYMDWMAGLRESMVSP